MEKTELIERCVRIIRENAFPEEIILFGSYGYGTPTEESDLDFYVLKELPEEAVQETAVKIFSALRPIRLEEAIDVDVFVDSRSRAEARAKAGDRFLQEILTKGKVLYAQR